MYNVTLRGICATIVTVEKQQVLHAIYICVHARARTSVCVCVCVVP